MNKPESLKRSAWQSITTSVAVLVLLAGVCAPSHAQQILGAITGTVKDSSGGAVPDASVEARNVATNLAVTARTQPNGSYSVSNLPAGTYKLSFTKDGFDTETHSGVEVNGDRTTTVDSALKIGSVATKVDVVGTPMMNQVDTTTGYVVTQSTLDDTPLSEPAALRNWRSLEPGRSRGFSGRSGQQCGARQPAAIFANGNRDTSNSFSLNGIESTNNLFNGNSTSQVGANRFVLNTGENFGAGGGLQTSTSVYDAIGQALPTPPTEAIQEIAVNSAMYDASQGANSGAHISVLTKSGSNDLHGELYEKFQNSAMNAAPFFYNASPAITNKVPFLNRNQFGATLGGPIRKDKLFYFVSYQGVRIADAADSTKTPTVPLTLTDDRSLQGIVNTIQGAYGNTIAQSQIDPVAAAMLKAKLPGGQYLIPSAKITDSNTALSLGYDLVEQGPNAQSSVNQGIASVDYIFELERPDERQVFHPERSHYESVWISRRSDGICSAIAGWQPRSVN